MKNLLTALLPALALFALGGCAGTSALTSSEDDGVYYSSKDRTTAVVSPAPAPAGTDEATNPDYNGNQTRSSARQGSGSNEYYDNTYTYMRGVPSYGVTTYVPYSPYTVISYNSYGSYGWGGGACGYSPYAYGGYDPFYSPFYSPYYGYGPSINISFGFGQPYGYGGYGYGRPYGYGYGYGGGFYDPYYYNSPYYGGYYGRGGYYGNNYYGGSYYGGRYGNGYSNNGYYGNDNRNRVTTGHRSDRMSDGRYSTGSANSAGTTGSSAGGGRVRTDGLIAPTTPAPTPTTQPMPGVANEGGGRFRSDAVTAAPSPQPTRSEGSFNRPRRLDRADQPQYRDMEQMPTTTRPRTEGMPADQGQVTRDNTGGRWRNTDTQPRGDQMQPQSQPEAEQPVRQDGQRRRGGFFQDVFTQPNTNGGRQASEQQPERQRSYDQPRQRTYEQPQQRSYEQPQQRTYEQPQQRSFEQPQQRSFEQPQRSNNQPSNSGGNEGGGGGHSRSRGE